MGYIKFAVLIFLFSLPAWKGFAQDRKYDPLWKRVDSLSKVKGLTKSALSEVEKIYQLAKKENNDPQLIKSLIYRLNLQENFQEDALQKSITQLEAEIKTTREPAASILNSMLAEKYWQYFQQFRYKLYGRTEMVEEKENPDSWSISQFHRKISEKYLLSVKNQQLLQQVPLKEFEPIIIKGNTRNLRPTLFDLLAHRAISYFRNEERDVTRPAYAFFINDHAAFADAAEFIRHRFITTDTLSLQHKALTLYQSVLRFHANDTDPAAFIDADIQRIEFVRQYGQMEDKDSLYLRALEGIVSRYPDYKTAADAYLRIAQFYASLAAKYNAPADTSYRYEYNKARDILEKLVKANANNEASGTSVQLLYEINHQTLLLHTEKVNIPGQPFRTLVYYRNLPAIHLKVIPLTDALKEQLRNRYDDSYWQRLASIAGIRNWSQALPQTNDHQQHRVEIKIDALPAGNYILFASADEKFTPKGNAVAAQHFFVSNISYVNNGNDFFFLHRETGKPLANATVQVWNEGYDYTARKQVLQAAERVTPDEHGFVRIKKRDKPNIQIKLEVRYNNDRLFQDENYYGQYPEQRRNPLEINAARYEQENSRVFFFTDRSIYRPGQKVFFKGIAVTRDFQTRKNKVLAGYSTTVKLYNANHEVVDSITVTTSEYGSYNGTFQLPDQGMNGQWLLHDDKLKSDTYVAVEEYKRPKFFIKYDEIKTTYRLNDSIRVTGAAKAYAGNNIEGAVINYTVTREPRFLYPWLRSSRWGYPRTSRMNVANGTAITDAEGNFTIVFKAIPDRSIDTSFQPVFDYRIIASVTDINGETRVAEKLVSVSYKALQLNVSLFGNNTLSIDSLKAIKISTLNMNGQAEPSVVRLQIFRLKGPDRIIRQRYWPTPDLFVMDKDEFLKYFPNDEYQEESEVQRWPKQEMVFEISDSTTKESAFPLNNKLFSEGWYVAEAVTRDKYGSQVKTLLYFQLFDEKSNKVSLPLYSWNAQDKFSIEPGEQLTIGIGSAASDVFVIQHTHREINHDLHMLPAENENPASYQFLTLNKEKKWLPVTAKEGDKGGFGIFHFFVRDNRFYMLSNVVGVPWSDKNLSVSYETFRDKVLPGSDEKWKMKISGLKKEKVAAEILASMYDASLDQFQAHDWSVPDVWPVYVLNQPWSWRFSFTDVQAHQRYQERSNLIIGRKIYDRLLTNSYSDMLAQDGAAIYGSRRMFDVAEAAPTAGVRLEGKAVNADMLLKRTPGLQVGSEMETNKSSIEEAVVTALPRQPGVLDDGSSGQPRKNFNETAFFIPELKTDAEGNIEFSFTIPEALTRWKFQALSHTKELAFALSSKEIVTQKELMVQPNAPRFLREGDRMELSTKVVNLSAREITGTVQLELLNAATMQPVDGWFQNAMPQQFFTVEAGKSGIAAFRIEVPYQYNSGVIYRFIARSTPAHNAVSLSDGEEAMLPVLSNSLLVTETMPLPVRGKAVKNFRFEKLLTAGSSESLKHHALTVEFTSNPAWYVVQALPYLAAPTYESADQLFNRYYANALAFNIANSSPRLRETFERWKHLDTAALLSNLQKNQELKSILLQETPWVLQGKTESQQKQNIALLFDVNRMGSELSAALEQVKNMQSPNGGFQWFKGAPDDIYITQYILTSIGHLKKLNAVPPKTNELLQEITGSAIKYLDERIKDNYEKVTRRPKVKLTDNHIGPYQIQYLYMRSFFSDIPITGSAFTAINFYRKQAQQYWLKQSRYMQGMIALALFRTGDKEKAREIIRSLEENSIYHEEMGRYWKENTGGFYWYQAPVETQTLLIEAFSEIGTDKGLVNELKTWLLKQKQTQNWKTTKATAEACYALLLPFGSRENRGGITDAGWLASEPVVEIKLGEKIIRSGEQKSEAGTGYFKHTYDAPFIQPQMGNISVSVTTDNKEEVPAWGAVYWQYFERLDNITTASAPLKLEKKLFVEKNTDRGPLLVPVTDGYLLKKGDKIKVRIELSTGRDMEYVHMKDMRASCMEPVNVISRYKWQGGLGYYETTKDAATNFFFSWLPKGSYVFEYPMFVSHTGNFSNGITSVQCLYAPEFASHSEGVRVNVE